MFTFMHWWFWRLCLPEYRRPVRLYRAILRLFKFVRRMVRCRALRLMLRLTHLPSLRLFLRICRRWKNVRFVLPLRIRSIIKCSHMSLRWLFCRVTLLFPVVRLFRLVPSFLFISRVARHNSPKTKSLPLFII